jgi:hypothetical protein
VSPLTQALDSRALAEKLDTEGFVCIENAIDPAWIERAQAYVHEQIAERGKRYFVVTLPSRVEGSPANQLTEDPGFRGMMEDLVRLGCPRAKLEDEIYNGLRVVAGQSGDKKSLIHHYDRYVITALVPILIPEGPKRLKGELLLFPNTRKYRRFALFNILEKAVLQSNWYQRRFTRRLPEGDMPEIRYLKPGNLYLFWGYRTYHTNFPVAPDLVRATLLLHHGEPHPKSLVLDTIRTLQIRKERRILKQKAA